MDIIDLIGMVEETIDNSFKIPFTSKGFVDKEELLETIQEIRLKFPDELKQGKFLIEDRHRIMAVAQTEADNIIKNDFRKEIAFITDEDFESALMEKINSIKCDTLKVMHTLF